MGRLNRRAILNASGRLGSYLPVSMAFTVWRDTFNASARSPCDHPREARSSRRWLTIGPTRTTVKHPCHHCQAYLTGFRLGPTATNAVSSHVNLSPLFPTLRAMALPRDDELARCGGDTIADELLVVRCQLGEHAAFEELIARWHTPL